jgi:acyl-CoA hydrolase
MKQNEIIHMWTYQNLAVILKKYFKSATLFKYGFNWSPMYRRSTGKIVSVSEDLHQIQIKIPLSYKNRNYVGSIFGGSLFAATDPILMVQLFNILGDAYVVWDKSAEIKFKKPVREDVYAFFEFTNSEIETIKTSISLHPELEITKQVYITNPDQKIIYCDIRKVIYIADKQYYRNKIRNRSQS